MALEPLPFRGLPPPPGFAMFFLRRLRLTLVGYRVGYATHSNLSAFKICFYGKFSALSYIPFTDQRLA